MKLGLGLGLTRNQPKAAGPVNWTAWDGSNDGDVQNLFTEGSWGPTVGVFEDDTTFYQLSRFRGAPSKRRFSVMTLNDEGGISERSGVGLAGNGDGVFPFMCRLSSTRVLCGMSGGTASSSFRIALINVSNLDSPTILDEEGLPSFCTEFGFNAVVERLTDTKAVLSFTDESSSPSNKITSVIVDLTSDTITYGTPLASAMRTIRYTSLCVLNSNTFLIAANSSIILNTVSGTTITQEDSLTIDGTNAAFDDMVGLVRLTDTKAMLCYEDNGSPNKIWANVYNISGTTLSRGTRVEVQSGPLVFGGPAQNGGFAADENTAVFVYTPQVSPFQDVNVAVVSVDGSNVCSLDANISKGSLGDHPQISTIGTTGSALIISQNSSTSPVDAIGYQVLNT